MRMSVPFADRLQFRFCSPPLSSLSAGTETKIRKEPAGTSFDSITIRLSRRGVNPLTLVTYDTVVLEDPAMVSVLPDGVMVTFDPAARVTLSDNPFRLLTTVLLAIFEGMTEPFASSTVPTAPGAIFDSITELSCSWAMPTAAGAIFDWMTEPSAS